MGRKRKTTGRIRPKGYWCFETMRAELVPWAEKYGRHPTVEELRAAGEHSLASKACQYGGIAVLLEGLDFAPKEKKPKVWTEERILTELARLGAEWGYMPTCHELKRAGYGALSAECGRRGYWQLAKKLNLPVKASRQKLGIGMEFKMKKYLEERGYRVRKERTCGPYDLLVDGIRVDVKCSRPLQPADGQPPIYHFGFKTRGTSCDLYLCVSVDSDENIVDIFYVPTYAGMPKALALPLVPLRKSKYGHYRNNRSLLDETIQRVRGRVFRLRKSRK